MDFQWLTKAQKEYGEPDEGEKKKKVFKQSRNKQADVPGLIRLHYQDDIPAEEETAASESSAGAQGEGDPAPSSPGRWTVSSLTLTTPDGDDIEIRSRKPAAIAELLTKLAV